MKLLFERPVMGLGAGFALLVSRGLLVMCMHCQQNDLQLKQMKSRHLVHIRRPIPEKHFLQNCLLKALVSKTSSPVSVLLSFSMYQLDLIIDFVTS